MKKCESECKEKKRTMLIKRIRKKGLKLHGMDGNHILEDMHCRSEGRRIAVAIAADAAATTTTA